MASKLALVAFVALLLLAHAGAWLCAAAVGERDVGGAASAPRAAAAVSANRASGPSRDTHILWNAACWLFGVGLVLTRGRSSELAPALD